MPKPYLKEFREDVVRVAQIRDENTTVAEVAADFGLHEATIRKRVRQSELDAGNPNDRKPGLSTDEKDELRTLRRRNRAREQELEVMRRTAAYFGQAQISSK